MANIRRSNRQIRGPQSALTDFLASHNIDANQIRENAIARRAAALASQQAENGEQATSSSNETTATSRRKNETKEQELKRKQVEETTIAAIKASKSSKRRRRFVNSDDELSDGSRILRQLNGINTVPEQIANCELCQKRFLVTAYSRAGPGRRSEGLLCPKCSRDLDTKERAEKNHKKQISRAARRKNASKILDGIYPGAKDLVTICVETLANHVHEAESFGSLPPELVKKVGAILSKRRLITSPILDLFLDQKHDTLVITDGAKLNSDDYCRIFQIVPSIKHLKLRNAIQFKNRVVDFLLGTTANLITLDLHGANLIDDETWDRFLRQKGSSLRALKVHFTDSHFGDSTVQILPKCCPHLQRLKISHNFKISDDGLENIAYLSNLEHFSLELYRPLGVKPLSPTPLVKILDASGPRLSTFSIETVPDIDDSVLAAIHNNCKQLKKLRITGSEKVTDAGFELLFRNWDNPPIQYIDFSGCRHIDAVESKTNTDNIGLCSQGFEALMCHSGSNVKHLNISSCRHISRQSFEATFSAEKQYPDFEHIDVSFCPAVNDYIVGCIFRSCPALKVLTVFGCFGVKDVKVPKGRILIGTPNTIGMKIEGTQD